MSAAPAAIPAEHAQPALEVRDLRVSFRSDELSVQVVNGVSYSVAPGEALGVVGESGSGKSVSVRAILGLLPVSARVSASALRLGGRDLLTMSSRDRRRLCGVEMSIVLQDAFSALDPVFTVGYQIAEVFRVHERDGRRKATKKAIELMERVGIADARRRFDAYPHEFSGGMRQRALIAMAIALKPALLIADEPTTALDLTVQAQILELLRQLQRETGMALILIAHDISVVADVTNRIVVMYAGELVEIGPTARVCTEPAHPYTRALLNSIPRAAQRKGELIAIPGGPPDLAHLPHGCPFSPRCTHRRDRCIHERPTLRNGEDDHECACHFAGELTLETSM